MLPIEERIKVEQQVEAFIDIMATRYGIKQEDIPGIIDDLRWVADHRRSINRVAWSAILGVVALVVSGAWMMLWEGVKQTIAKGAPH